MTPLGCACVGHGRHLIIGVWLFLLMGPATAGLINGGFEDGSLTGWTDYGSVVVQGDDFGAGPVVGNHQAHLRTALAAGTREAAADMEDTLGHAPGSLSDLVGDVVPTSGSLLTQDFEGHAGETISFHWNFLTDEPTQLIPFNDFAFVSLVADGRDEHEPSLSLLADTTSDLTTSDTDFAYETGFQLFEYILPEPGVYTLGLGVLDVGDHAIKSGLLVDDVRLTAAQLLPLPATALLVGGGLLLLLGSTAGQGRRAGGRV